MTRKHTIEANEPDATIRKIQQKYKVSPLGLADVLQSLNSVVYNKRKAADCIWCVRLAQVNPSMQHQRTYIAKMLKGAAAHRLMAMEVAKLEAMA